MLLADVAATSEAVRAAPGRREKWERIAECLRAAGPDEVAIAVAYLSGELRQRQLGIGWAGVRELPPPAAAPTLELRAVDAALGEIAAVRGSGAVAARRERLQALFVAATAPEQRLLRGLVIGELRQGALEGVVVEAVARAAEVPVAAVRRALTVAGALPAVAEAAVAGGAPALAAMRLEVGRPLRPMLAQTAASIPEALGRIAPAALELKLDGARVQVHRDGADVAIFTRSLDEITARLPEVVAAVQALPAHALVLDGEVIALDEAGRPHPFQITASRVGTRTAGGAGAAVPLTPVFFDLLHLDGESYLDHPGAGRRAALDALAPAAQRIERVVTADVGDGEAFLAGAIARGHEGVMVKALDAAYEAGSRGASWLKVKREHTLDLVVLAAEWGHGRRRGFLSNLHLGARDAASGGFVMLGKTFKGLTDAMLAWQTERLLALEERRDAYTVHVRPELVVEIAFDGFQASTRYPGGVALRFARVRRYREDKTAAQADTIETVHALFAGPGRA
jgi:DNA ligase-1